MTQSDPLGKALLDYYHNKKKVYITVRSNIAETEKWPVSYFFRTENEMPDIEKKALSMCKGNILEVGAGAGSHALILQQKGFDVTAIDCSEGAVSVMKKRGLHKAVYANIFSFTNTFQYDTILLLMNGIGVAGTIEGYKQLLKQLKKCLTKGGKIIFDSSDIAYLYSNKEGAFVINMNGDYYGEIIYKFEYQKEKSEAFPWIFLSYQVAAMYAEECGFEPQLIETNQTHYLASLTVR
jgi:2-polyprenyl-3-methyl-5-hydroxy-6-metoxy-1,4-benzoquinol methylase